MKRLWIVAVLLAIIAIVAAIESQGADAPFGLFRWESIVDRGRDDNSQAVVVSGNTAIVSEWFGKGGGQFDIAVRAYNVMSGQTIWEDIFIGDSRAPLAISGSTVIIAAPSNGVLVKAYNIADGQILWANYWGNMDGQLTGLAAANGKVVVVGGNGLAGSVKTLNASTGSLLWESIIAHAGYMQDIVWAVASDGTRTVVAGNVINDPNIRHLILRSYNASTGALQWESMALNVSPTAVKIAGNRVIVVGGKQDPSLQTFFAGYDLASGQFAWSAASVPGVFFSLGVGVQAVAAGRTPQGILVQSVTPSNGSTQWDDETALSAGFGEELLSVAITNNAVYVAGHSWQTSVYSETLVRGYNLVGTMLFEDRRHRAVSLLSDLAVSGQNLVSTGYKKATMSSTSDTLVLAYDITQFEPPFTVSSPLMWSKPIPVSILMRNIGKR
jgi:hypothetical protein